VNNSPDEDAELTNFLRQNRSIAQPEQLELEDRLMSQIDLLPPENQRNFSHSWFRSIVGGIGLILTGVVGMTIFQIVNPSEPSIAELNQLNLYLEAHSPSLSGQLEASTETNENLVDIDVDLF
jgi:hypothetical protein